MIVETGQCGCDPFLARTVYLTDTCLNLAEAEIGAAKLLGLNRVWNHAKLLIDLWSELSWTFARIFPNLCIILIIDTQKRVLKPFWDSSVVTMAWCYLWLLFLWLDLRILASSGSQFARLSFSAHCTCTYSYELVVHTARGSHSTESDGFQVHALVSRTVFLVRIFKLQRL